MQPSLGRYLADGNLFVAVGGVPVAFNGGLGYTAAGALCVTTALSGTDVYVAGMRVSAAGLLVVGNAPPPARRFFVAGHMLDLLDGSFSRQLNQVPAPSDPFINGSREGPNGSCYMNNIGPPVTP